MTCLISDEDAATGDAAAPDGHRAASNPLGRCRAGPIRSAGGARQAGKPFEIIPAPDCQTFKEMAIISLLLHTGV